MRGVERAKGAAMSALLEKPNDRYTNYKSDRHFARKY